jgi:hypothetical protein
MINSTFIVWLDTVKNKLSNSLFNYDIHNIRDIRVENVELTWNTL